MIRKIFPLFHKNKNKFIIPLIGICVIFILTLIMIFPSGKIIFANGSTTVLPLLESLGYDYSDSPLKAKIAVSGGGSTVGINFIMQKLTDIGDASRNPEKVEYGKNIWKSNQLSTFPIAYDGIVFGINSRGLNLPSDSTLKINDLYKIFSGQVKTWDEIFPNASKTKIYLILRESGSGTRDSFYAAMNTYGYHNMKLPNSKNLSISNSNGLSLSILSSIPGSIAYLPLSYINIISRSYKYIILPKINYNKNNPTDTINPNKPEVFDDIFRNGVMHPDDKNYYLFWHPLNLIISLKSDNQKYLFDFLYWVISEDHGQEIVNSQKYLNIYCNQKKCDPSFKHKILVIDQQHKPEYLSTTAYFSLYIKKPDYNKSSKLYWWKN